MHWVSELPAVYMYLIIDPSSPEVVRFSLVDTGFRTAKEYTADHAGFLGALDNFFEKRQVTRDQVAGIAVVVGAGTFTRTRLAVTLANIWSFAYHIPVRTITFLQSADAEVVLKKFIEPTNSKYITAIYSGEPNIGKKYVA